MEIWGVMHMATCALLFLMVGAGIRPGETPGWEKKEDWMEEEEDVVVHL